MMINFKVSLRLMLCVGMLLIPLAGFSTQSMAETKPVTTPPLKIESLLPATGFEKFADFSGDRSFHSNIALYETVLSFGPVVDPRPVFLLANAYIVTNQQKIGIAFFEQQFESYSDKMSPETEAVYLSAYALLRATYADDVNIFQRIGWVLDTFEILERADSLAGGKHPLVHWAAGIIYTQVPRIFGMRDEAYAHLKWLEDHPETEPTPGFYREVYRHLAILEKNKGNQRQASKYLARSGYEAEAPETLFMGWFASDSVRGLRFAPAPEIAEIVPGRIFAVRGFGFSELHFMVSEDGQHLISIDAGTQPSSLQEGLEYLKRYRPRLPPLTTVFVTHAHWDHIGGHGYFRSLDQDVTFYGRENFGGTVERADRKHAYKQFRGAGFKSAWITDYSPDVVVSEIQTVSIGGSQIELVPAMGGETEDALLVFVPALGVAFAGDAFMPFYGEPWVEEGHIEEAIQTLDVIIERQPEHILHGHYGLTEIYGTMPQLTSYRDAYAWLIEAAKKLFSNGYSTEEIRRFNLIPPGLQNQPEGLFGYLAARDHVIARIGDKMTGIWRENSLGDDPRGLDNLTLTEYGRMLDVYLDLSPNEIEDGIERMLDGGDNELALKMASAALRRFPDSRDVRDLRNLAADRLRSANQYFDPFRFVTYTEMSDQNHPSMPLETSEQK
ncbi:MAG: hypothetical protein Pars92KO_27320 [Parasphingorhabdus sp.]